MTTSEPLRIEPIGFFRGESRPHFSLPPQAGVAGGVVGRIELRPGLHLEAAVEDLATFSHIWVVFWFHAAIGWKPKVRPPLRTGKRGVLATRSPHRPNPIGLSCLRLTAVHGLTIDVAEADLIDGTPILDVKPYLVYADSHPNASTGWLNGEPEIFRVSWEESAIVQRDWLRARGCELGELVDATLALAPFPRRGHRVRDLGVAVDGDLACFACRTWRVAFVRNREARSVRVTAIDSGHSEAALRGEPTPWNDAELHRAFVRTFRVT